MDLTKNQGPHAPAKGTHFLILVKPPPCFSRPVNSYQINLNKNVGDTMDGQGPVVQLVVKF